MRAGADVIYQAPFALDEWRGIADFLERIDTPSALGDYSYEAVDTKLARNEMLPHHALQLCFYAAGIAHVQEVWPEWVHVELGSGERESIRVHEIGSYARHAKEGMQRDVAARAPTEPIRCDHCPFCEFRPVCEEHWETVDHLTRVAGMRRDQVLPARGGGRDDAHAARELPPAFRVPDLRPDALGALAQQARLQRAAVEGTHRPRAVAAGGRPRFRTAARAIAGRCHVRLRGRPLLDARAGSRCSSRDCSSAMATAGAMNPSGRTTGPTRKWRSSASSTCSRRDSPSSPTCTSTTTARPSRRSVKQLMAQHATREAEVDDLLRRGVFVDLLTVTRQALRAGVRSYSLKQTERLAGFARVAGMGAGSEAVLGYERWCDSRDQTELDAIAAYNEEDCLATAALRNWLLAVRPPGITGPAPDRVPGAGRGGRRGGDGTRAAPAATHRTASRRGRRAGWPANCSSTTAARIDPCGGGTSPVARWTRASSWTTARRSPG